MLTGRSDKKIFELLDSPSLWARRACREILRRWEDFVPLLLGFLEGLRADPGQVIKKGRRMRHIPIALLLAQMREKRAFPLLLDLIRPDDPMLDLLWDDLLCIYYPQILGDTFDGGLGPLQDLMEDRSVSHWARREAIDTLALLYLEGRIRREEALGCLRRLVHEVYRDDKPGEETWSIFSSVVSCIHQMDLEELLGDVKTLYDQDKVDPALYGPWENYMAGFSQKDPLERHIDDAVGVLETLQWFQEDEEGDDGDDFDEDFDDDFDDDFDGDEDDFGEYDGDDGPLIPARSKKPPAGRNDPCPCGSGKKYKKCCMNKP
jgi:hypothetical protein